VRRRPLSRPAAVAMDRVSRTGQSSPSTSMRACTTPRRRKPSMSAAACDRSAMRAPTNGPRSSRAPRRCGRCAGWSPGPWCRTAGRVGHGQRGDVEQLAAGRWSVVEALPRTRRRRLLHRACALRKAGQGQHGQRTGRVGAGGRRSTTTVVSPVAIGRGCGSGCEVGSADRGINPGMHPVTALTKLAAPAGLRGGETADRRRFRQVTRVAVRVTFRSIFHQIQ